MVDTGGTCSVLCGIGSFCGSDNQCHLISCHNWYEFGNPKWTDYNPDIPLTCSTNNAPFPIYEGLEVPAVVFGCTHLFELPEPPQGVFQPFNRRCLREDDPNVIISANGSSTTFECYEMDEATNFQPFIDEAASAKIDPCTDEPSDPGFLYQVHVVRRNDMKTANVSRSGATFDMGYRAMEFNETTALRTMFARVVVSNVPTDGPSVAPSSAPFFDDEEGNDAYCPLDIKTSFILVLITTALLRQLWI